MVVRRLIFFFFLFFLSFFSSLLSSFFFSLFPSLSLLPIEKKRTAIVLGNHSERIRYLYLRFVTLFKEVECSRKTVFRNSAIAVSNSSFHRSMLIRKYWGSISIELTRALYPWNIITIIFLELVNS